MPPHAPPGDPQGAVPPPSVVLAIQFYTGTDVASVLPRRVMGYPNDPPPSFPHCTGSPAAHVPWGKEGDDCAICLGVMAAGEHVSDLPGRDQVCNHTFHLQCAAAWLTTRVQAGKKGCCPVCNAEIIQPILAVRRRPRVSREPPSPCALCIMSLLVIVAIVAITLLYIDDNT